MRKAFDGNSFSPHELIVVFPIEWGGKTVTVDVEVVNFPLDYKFMLGFIWIHVIMAIVSSESRVIRFHHWGNIVMIDQILLHD